MVPRPPADAHTPPDHAGKGFADLSAMGGDRRGAPPGKGFADLAAMGGDRGASAFGKGFDLGKGFADLAAMGGDRGKGDPFGKGAYLQSAAQSAALLAMLHGKGGGFAAPEWAKPDPYGPLLGLLGKGGPDYGGKDHGKGYGKRDYASRKDDYATAQAAQAAHLLAMLGKGKDPRFGGKPDYGKGRIPGFHGDMRDDGKGKGRNTPPRGAREPAGKPSGPSRSRFGFVHDDGSDEEPLLGMGLERPRVEMEPAAGEAWLQSVFPNSNVSVRDGRDEFRGKGRDYDPRYERPDRAERGGGSYEYLLQGPGGAGYPRAPVARDVPRGMGPRPMYPYGMDGSQEWRDWDEDYRRGFGGGKPDPMRNTNRRRGK